MTDLSDVAFSSQEKRVLLEQLLLRKMQRPSMLPPSFAQKRLWFLAQLEPDNPFYTMSGALRLQGTLHEDALELSLNNLVARHETLRTHFALHNGQPVQVIIPSLLLPLKRIDAAVWPIDEREARLQQLLDQEEQHPFTLQQGPLVRATLLRLDAQEHVLVITLHHIISDGWSLGTLIRELAAFYQAAVNQQSATLPALPMQYADYALRQ